MLTILYPAGLLQDFLNNLAFYKVNKAGGTIYVIGLQLLAKLLQDCQSSLKYSSYVTFTLIFTCDMPELQGSCRIVARLLVFTQKQYMCTIHSLLFSHVLCIRLLQECCKMIATQQQDCCQIVGTNSNTIQKKLDRDCCKIVTRLLQDCCKNVVKSILDPTIFCEKLSIT